MTRNTLGSLVVALALAVPSLAFGAVPAVLIQQGRLFDATGTPKTGTVTMVFNLYAAATGGSSLWTEVDSVTLDQGYFSVQLGGKTVLPSTLWDGAIKYIGVTVGNDPEMAPREPVTSVPYALVANSASLADHAVSADTAGTITGTVPASQISGMFTPAQLPASIPASRISGTIDGSLVSKVASAAAADAAASASGSLATTLSSVQTQIATLSQGHTVFIDGTTCTSYVPTSPNYEYDQAGLSATNLAEVYCALPVRVKATTTISGLTAFIDATAATSCYVEQISLASLTAGSYALTQNLTPYSAAGTADNHALALPLGGPYTTNYFPKSIHCFLPAGAHLEGISWTESE